MPEYDYQCNKCGAEFVKNHPMAFNGKVKCPACGSARTVKIFHAAGVVFKGSGFYVTDSSNSRQAASGLNTNGDSPDKSEATETPAAKPAVEPSANGKPQDKGKPKTADKKKK